MKGLAALLGAFFPFLLAAASAGGVQPSGPSAPAPKAEYRYQPAGKVDPFKPFLETEVQPAAKKEEKRPRPGVISPLQQAEVGQFRLVGISGSGSQRMAVVQDEAAKRFYPIFVGTAIGLNDGRVVEILPDRVIIEERFRDEGAKPRVERMTLMLHKEGTP